MLSAAGSLQWLGMQSCRAPPGTSCWPRRRRCRRVASLLFAPYLAGERTPYADPHARGAFVGLSLRHGRGALVRAVLEGVAYGLRDSLELVRELGVRPEVGRVSGGGARNALWREIVASALELPLETTTAEEGSAYGAALLAGCRAGVFAGPREAAERCVRIAERREPNPEWTAVYREGYERYRCLYPALCAGRP
jgi:xylulokinase